VSFLPDHLRLRAQMLLGLDAAAHDDALAALLRSVEVARSHGARSFELRAALAAGRLLHEIGRGDEGRALVAGAYAGFTESFDDPDLCDARAFLS
jgi:predicted ATPase